MEASGRQGAQKVEPRRSGAGLGAGKFCGARPPPRRPPGPAPSDVTAPPPAPGTRGVRAARDSGARSGMGRALPGSPLCTPQPARTRTGTQIGARFPRCLGPYGSCDPHSVRGLKKNNHKKIHNRTKKAEAHTHTKAQTAFQPKAHNEPRNGRAPSPPVSPRRPPFSLEERSGVVGEGCSRFDSRGRFLGIFPVSALPTPPALCPLLSLLFALHFL